MKYWLIDIIFVSGLFIFFISNYTINNSCCCTSMYSLFRLFGLLVIAFAGFKLFQIVDTDIKHLK